MDRVVDALNELSVLLEAEKEWIHCNAKRRRRDLRRLLEAIYVCLDILLHARNQSEHRRACLLGHFLDKEKVTVAALTGVFPDSVSKRNAVRRHMLTISDVCIEAIRDGPAISVHEDSKG